MSLHRYAIEASFAKFILESAGRDLSMRSVHALQFAVFRFGLLYGPCRNEFRKIGFDMTDIGS